MCIRDRAQTTPSGLTGGRFCCPLAARPGLRHVNRDVCRASGMTQLAPRLAAGSHAWRADRRNGDEQGRRVAGERLQTVVEVERDRGVIDRVDKHCLDPDDAGRCRHPESGVTQQRGADSAASMSPVDR